MLYTVLVRITHDVAAPPEEIWLANCQLKKGKLYRTIAKHTIEGDKVVRKEKTVPIEDGNTEILDHIEQKGWYY